MSLGTLVGMRIPRPETTEPRRDIARGRLHLLLCVLLAALFSAPTPAQDAISWTSTDRGAAADERYVGEPIDMSLRDADLVETLRTFARIGGFNLLVQPGIRGSVTVELRGVPWDQALEAILKTHGLGLEVSGGTLRVASYETLEEEARNQRFLDSRPLLERQVIEGRLRHADAERVAELLLAGPYLSRYGKATALDENVLRIEERVGRVRRVARFVQALDDAGIAELRGAALQEKAAELWRALDPD